MRDRGAAADVRRRAVEFRTALDVVKPEHPCLPEFPRGWCTMASMLLGEYFRGVGLGEFRTRSGKRSAGERTTTHAWLEQDGLLVDITADQFHDVDQPVLVVRDSEWHHQWAPISGGSVASLAFYEGDEYQELVAEMYERVHLAAQDSVPGAGLREGDQ